MNRKAVLSYKNIGSDAWFVTTLINELSSKGFFVQTTSRHRMADSIAFINEPNLPPPGANVNSEVHKLIKNADLFIGLITRTKDSWSFVSEEWSIAKKSRVPCFLLIEQGLGLETKFREGSNPENRVFVTFFNRSKPNEYMGRLERQIKEAEREIERLGALERVQNQDKALSWIVGGIAVVALLSLLSEKK